MSLLYSQLCERLAKEEGGWLLFQLCEHLAEEEGDGCFVVVFFLFFFLFVFFLCVFFFQLSEHLA